MISVFARQLGLKIFVDYAEGALEGKIVGWLQSHPNILIVDQAQSSGLDIYGDLFTAITIWYKRAE